MNKMFNIFLMSFVFFMGFTISSCGNSEDEARTLLNHALLLKQEGKLDEAKTILKKIATQYPKTKVATEAIKELEQLKTEIALTAIFNNSDEDMEKRKRVKAKVDIQFIEVALKTYKLDNGNYPSTEQGLGALVSPPNTGNPAKNWREGGYCIKTNLKDPWQNDYIYLCPGNHGEFDISSYGADGMPGGVDENTDINNWEID